jgi:hypothetical protein
MGRFIRLVIQSREDGFMKSDYRGPKYNWVGNRIKEEDMAKLHQLKQETKKPITFMVAEAVSEYLVNVEKKGGIK